MKKISISIIFVLVIIITIILIYKGEIQTNNEAISLEDAPIIEDLEEKERIAKNEEIKREYKNTKNLSFEQVKEEIKKELAANNIDRVYEFEYEFDPKDDNNRNKVYDKIKEYESEFVADFGYDTVFFTCISEIEENANYCLNIKDTFKRVECVEGVRLIQALRYQNSSLCEELGTQKLYPWCMAVTTQDASYCSNNDFENILFETNCNAMATRNIDLCNENKLDCYYDYYTILGIYDKEPNLCSNIHDENNSLEAGTEGDETRCKALVNQNKQYCFDQYLQFDIE